ncbi:MAG: DegV family protein [Eubacteriales bacterium]
MSKIAIVTDTNSGISVEEAKEKGILLIPMPFIINEETFFEGVTLTKEEFYTRMEADDNITTSQPSPESIMTCWEEALRDCDEVIHMPMSSGLSGSYQTAVMLSEDYHGKVHVVDNKRISDTLRQSVLDAIELSKTDITGEQLKNKLEEDGVNSTIYITLDTLHYLKKGGRLTPLAAALGTILKIKPVLTIQGSALDAFAKVRTTNQAKTMMINAITADIEKKLGGLGIDNAIRLAVVHSNNEELAIEYGKMVEEAFPHYLVEISELSLSIASHTGPGALAIACTRKSF